MFLKWAGQMLLKNLNQNNMTPEELARDIIDKPTNWGMYSIADEIHKMLKEKEKECEELKAKKVPYTLNSELKSKIEELKGENEKLKDQLDNIVPWHK